MKNAAWLSVKKSKTIHLKGVMEDIYYNEQGGFEKN